MYVWRWYDKRLMGWWNVRNSEEKGRWKYDIYESQQSFSPLLLYLNNFCVQRINFPYPSSPTCQNHTCKSWAGGYLGELVSITGRVLLIILYEFFTFHLIIPCPTKFYTSCMTTLFITYCNMIWGIYDNKNIICIYPQALWTNPWNPIATLSPDRSCQDHQSRISYAK